jgi:transposase
MTKSLATFANYCGVDVSEGQFDVHLLPDGSSARFAHTTAGIGRLVAWLASRERPLLVVEASRCRGSVSAGARARAPGRPAGSSVPWSRRWAARASRRLTAEIATIEVAMAARLEALATTRDRAALLVSVPGIGALTAASLLALLPELGRLDGKAGASLAGGARFARDSGLIKGRRTIWGGRKPVRTALDLATVSASPTSLRGIGRSPMVAARHNARISTFYQRLRAGGKAKKLALTACMRKLLVILNAMLRDGTPWQTAQST